MRIALDADIPILIHGSEPVGHIYKGKGKNDPVKLYELVKNNPKNKFVFSHFGGGLVFYEQMPEVKKLLRNVYYDSSAQPYLYGKEIYRNAINLSSIEKILFASLPYFSSFKIEGYFPLSSQAWKKGDQSIYSANSSNG